MRSKLFVHSSLFTGIQKDQKAQPVLRVRCWWCWCRSRFKVLTRRRQQLPLEHCAELPRHQLFNPGHGNYGNPVTRHRGEYSTPTPRPPLAFLFAIRICQDAGVLHITSSWHWQSCLNHYLCILPTSAHRWTIYPCRNASGGRSCWYCTNCFISFKFELYRPSLLLTSAQIITDTRDRAFSTHIVHHQTVCI